MQESSSTNPGPCAALDGYGRMNDRLSNATRPQPGGGFRSLAYVAALVLTIAVILVGTGVVTAEPGGIL